MQNYYNYFTEVEERFQQRRGSLLLLSTLDWALIETWRDAGVPLEAVLRGIDAAFDKHETKQAKGRVRRVNGLAWCAQAVMEAAEQMREASMGAAKVEPAESTGFEGEPVARHLAGCVEELTAAAAVAHERALPEAAGKLVLETAERLQTLEQQARAGAMDVEALEQTLRTLEEKLLAMLLATLPEEELSGLRAQASREIAPYRSRMQALQIRQIEQQFLEKRLLERYALPRLSLFYMRSDG
ncbi:hypothetical protein [Acidipila sp. EB88]|uniref:hypothetical protein n=1 Tax=Acidipila sp. EB88 TaxID=2305226 RepID=UPI000F5F9344|nr:hypothetical protein [Acidipila sp. EB88]RRA48636.1 hypothetical protein D1Y84_10410 [Acidipila sp. EB88]